MDDTGVYRALLAAAESGRGAALATVVRVKGSVPREVGSKMLIEPGRGIVGTIGGGCGEGEVIEAAEEVVSSGRARLVRVELLDDPGSWSPAVCGGIMDVLVEPVEPDVA